MKKVMFFSAVIGISLFFSGCITGNVVADYSLQNNWLCRESGESDLEADLFLLPGGDETAIAYPQISGFPVRFFIPEVPENDPLAALAAFRCFLKQDNGGRPFILMGSGDGVIPLLRLMKTALSDEVLCRRLIAVYLVDSPVKAGELPDFPFIRLSGSKIDTGVIVFTTVKSEKELQTLTADINTRIGAFWK